MERAEMGTNFWVQPGIEPRDDVPHRQFGQNVYAFGYFQYPHYEKWYRL